MLVHDSARDTVFAQLQTDSTSEQQVASIITPVRLKVRIHAPLVPGSKLQNRLYMKVAIVHVVRKNRHKSIFADHSPESYDIGHI